MKTKLFLLVLIIFTSCSTATKTPQPTPTPPVAVSMDIPGHEFQLLPYPASGQIPYVSNPAFVRLNGGAIEVSSHCGETPGDYFSNSIHINDTITLFYSDASKQDYSVSKIVIVKYQNPSNPYSGDWIEQSTGKHYTPNDFSTYILQPKSLVIHSSICNQNVAFGQTFYIAYRIAK